MKINGKKINLRLVEIEDAAFLLSLRLDPQKNRHLSHVDRDLNKQKEWLVTYKNRERNNQEYYFIVEDKCGDSFGCVRVYDFDGDSFCWGSWILKDGSPSYMAVESALQIYEFAFFKLGFLNCHFEVRKENVSVLNFHKRFGARVVSDDELHYYFNYNKDDYEKIRPRYLKFIQ